MAGGTIKIGTSGWSYEHWRGLFYPEGLASRKWLEYYSQYFDTVEINSSFYRLPKAETFSNWRKRVGSGFVFSVKASRFITHVKRIKDVEEPVENFIERAVNLKEKLGPVLFQLPPNMKADTGRLRNFSLALPKNNRYVFEFRNDTWFMPEVYDILREAGAAVCISSSPVFPVTFEVTAGFVFLRMHGGQVLYGSDYPDEELKYWADKLREWAAGGLDAYVYFNNDANAYAIKNALKLKQLLQD